ncbi:MAG: response regulator [Clostridiaceae bacterium]|nr:response regulator [Clostridiaceae bacterium]
MYQVFVADDEAIILEGICSTINWERLGLELAGTAADGWAAYRGIERLRPDIILTDIRMPGLDGIQLLQKLRALPYQPVTIIITGHNEFGYARQALQLGVYDYISKPIDVAGLEQLLSEVVTQLEQKRAENEQAEQLRRQAESAENWELQNALRRYLGGSLDLQSLLKALPGGHAMEDYISGAIVQINQFDDLTDQMKGEEIFALTERFEQMIYYCSLRPPVLIEETAGKYFLLWTGSDRQEIQELRDLTLRRLRINWKECDYVTSTSEVKRGIAACSELYREASEALYQVFLKGGNSDYVYHEPVRDSTLPCFDTGVVVQAVMGLDKEAVAGQFLQLEQAIRDTGANSFLATRMMVSNVFTELIRLMDELNLPLGRMSEPPAESYRRILHCMTLADVMQELYRFVESICDAFSEEKRNSLAVVAEQAKAYIRANYQNPRLTLTEVSRHVGVSTNYFSLLLKKSLGKSFISYLTELRLQQAKNLLETTDCRSYEISYRCGYENATYFSTIFKKHFGLSPTEYRRQYLRQEG